MHLEKLLARQGAVEISLVSRDNFFLFTPMLHEIAASDLEITNIVNPLRKLLRKVEVLVGDVNEIDLPNKRVLISRGYCKRSRPDRLRSSGHRTGISHQLLRPPGFWRAGPGNEIAAGCDSIARPNHPTFGRGKFGMQFRRPAVVTYFHGGGRRLCRCGNGCSVK